jgi:hypothetical protein
MTLRTGKSGRYRYYTCCTKARQGETALRAAPSPWKSSIILSLSTSSSACCNQAPRAAFVARTRSPHRARRTTKVAHRRIAQAGSRGRRQLKRLYDAIENGIADLSAPMLKDRIGELKATRDQARLDAERAEDATERAGPTITPQALKRLPGRRASACGPMAAATAAITFARSPNASKSIRKNCASWDRKACFCARSSLLQAQKRQVLACPFLYRNGAPDTIRTCDLRLRRELDLNYKTYISTRR